MHFVFLSVASIMLAAAIFFLRPSLAGGWQRLHLPLLVAMLATPAIAIGGYLLLGSPDALDTAARSGQPPVGHLVAGLRARLAQNPDDRDGWLLLAKSYRHLGADDKARVALARAAAIDARGLAGVRAAVAGPTVRGHVALAPELADRVSPNDTVFIFAKESPAQRMPVAALRRSVQDLPLDFELTDTHAMVAGTRLDDFPSLVVLARVSPSGRAADAASTFETWSDPVLPGNDHIIDLVITDTAGPEESNHE